MNNIAQKNAIMRLNENIGLPYLYPGHIAYETATNISQANLNNTFTQLVDNDLYIENRLANDYAYAIGPKVYDKDKIDVEDNGYKTWGSANSYELSILQKKELPIQESLTKVFSTRSYFAVKYVGQYYVGTSDGLVFADEVDGQWRMLLQKACKNYFIDAGNGIALFACDDGIYQMKLDSENRKKLVKITKGQIDCTAVYFRIIDGLLIVASHKMLYFGTYTKHSVTLDDFNKCFESVQLEQCDIYQKDSYDIMQQVQTNTFTDVTTGSYSYKNNVFIGTSAGLAQLSSTNDFTRYSKLPALQDGQTCTAVAGFKDKVFLGTTAGIFMYDVDNGSLSATSITGNVTALAVHAQMLFVCVDGKLFKNEDGGLSSFEHCQLKLDGQEAEIAGIQKVVFIGDETKYVFFVLAGDEVYYGFNTNYSKMESLDVGASKIYDICSLPTKMTVDIACKKSSANTIVQYKFSSLRMTVSKTLDAAKLEKDGEDPAIVAEDNRSIAKCIQADGKKYLVTEDTICRSNDSSVSCKFEGKTIQDVKYIESKKSFVVLFNDAELSATDLELGTTGRHPTDLDFISQIVTGMQNYGFKGVYDYKELENDYAFIVTKQDTDTDGQECDQQHQNVERDKYFIAYAVTGNAGMQCGFLQSPATLDVATISAGTYSSPPVLCQNAGKIAVFDKANGRIDGSFSTSLQQAQFAQQFFKLGSDAQYKVTAATTWKNYVFVCAQTVGADPQQLGLYMNEIASVKKVAAQTYSPNYVQFDGSPCKQLVSGMVHKAAARDGMLYICTSAGLYVAKVEDIISVGSSLVLSELGEGNDIASRIVSGDAKDVCFIEDDMLAVATTNGIKLYSNQPRYKQASGTPCTVQDVGDSCSQLAMPYAAGCYLQVIAGSGQKLNAANYQLVPTGDRLSSFSTQSISTLSSVVGLAYCRRYTEGQQTYDEDGFIATLDEAGSVSALYFDSSLEHIAAVQPCVTIPAAKLIASSQYTDSEREYEDIDGRFVVMSDLSGGRESLSAFYKGSRDAQISIDDVTVLQSTSSRSFQNDPIVVLGSRWRQQIDGVTGESIICQDIYQVSKNQLKATTYKVNLYDGQCFYSPAAAAQDTWAELPSAIKNQAWQKWKVIDNYLHVLLGSSLYIVDLHVTGEALVAAEIQNVSDVFFSYDAAIVKVDGKYCKVDPYAQSIGEQLMFLDAPSHPSFMQQIGQTAMYGNFVQDNGQTDCSTSFATNMPTCVIRSFENSTSFTSIVYSLGYDSSNYSVFALALDGAVHAYTLDYNDMSLSNSLTLGGDNASNLYMDGSRIYAYVNATEMSPNIENISLVRYNSQLTSFMLDPQLHLSSMLMTQTERLSVDMLLTPYNIDPAQISIAGSTGTVDVNVINAVLGIKDNYSSFYIIATGHSDEVYVQIPNGTYVDYEKASSMQYNDSLQLFVDDYIVTNGKTIALRSDNSQMQWLELSSNMQLVPTSIYQLTKGGKLVQGILSGNSISSTSKIVCQSKSACFVKGVAQDDADEHWYYTYNDVSAQQLDLQFKTTGISWIDEDIADSRISVNDIYEDGKYVMYCTTDGLWKSVNTEHLEFVEDPAYTSAYLNADSEHIIANSSNIKICKPLYYSNFECIATVENEDGKLSVLGFELSDDLSTLYASDVPVISGDAESVKHAYVKVFILDKSRYADIFYVDGEEGALSLFWKHGSRLSYIDDHRQTAELLSSSISCMDEVDGLVYALGSNSFRFQSFKNNKTCFKQCEQLAGPDVTMLQQIDGDNYAVGGTQDGSTTIIWNVNLNTFSTTLLRSDDDNIGTYCSYKSAGSSEVVLPTYYFPFGNVLFNVKSDKLGYNDWPTELSVPSAHRINGIHVDTAKDILLATDIGLYYTYSKYTLENDIRKLTPNDVLDLFYKNIDDIDGTYNATIKKHIAERHANGSVLTRINNEIMDSKFSNVAEDWVKYDLDAQPGETIIQNDMLYDVKFGEVNIAEEKTDDTIRIDTSNTVCKQDNAQLNYIMKRWMSGYTELYINVPTTGTYYLNHILGTPNCTTNPNQLIERKNLGQLSTLTSAQKKQDSQVSSHCTYIDLSLEAAEYSIDELLEVTIHGNSLPLKIYRDNVERHYDNESSRLYQSMILPSVVTYTSDKPSSNGYYNFQFACFGTDAQAIKLSFNDYVNRYGSKYFIIEFNNNNGAGKQQSQKINIDSEVKLRKNMHMYKDKSAFLGWSLKAEVDGMSMPMFLDGQTISKALLEEKASNLKIQPGDTVTLFAVWEGYEPLDNQSCTEFIVSCADDGQTMTAVDSCVFVDDANPPDTLVVDYGDSES